MEGLKVEHWHQWEILCCHFMALFAKKNFGQNVFYQSYGSKGQSQFGIDLVPLNNNFPAVAQCKLKETSFTWKMLEDELLKTNNYNGIIEYYVLFTTANKHTSIQDKMTEGYYTHQRLNGTSFRVFVVYWSSIKTLDFIPRAVLESIFPSAFKIAMPTQLQGPTTNEYLISLRSLRVNLVYLLPEIKLNWLEYWDFSQGYVLCSFYDSLAELSIDYNRVSTALNNEALFGWLHEGSRALIAETLPAGNRFFSALEQFTSSINAHIIGKTLPGGEEILTLEGVENQLWRRITNEWRSLADYVLQVYREDVLGASRH
ncbi:hypothetical protein [Pseudomonas sp. dw_612]|uniref:hypothetical protein n=1 Tax=Pseudomonas sp. dw_612 TaxID=2720080 RepID=UPI001BD5886C|nr:hypothetical protein [Pseudomonas sp. dw_612]